ncbi:MAG TPA: hypothetical protein VFP20_02260 [Bacteroidales bacterium]|nr:hypothetical protein [Bacteroidales bacterium]
MKKNRKKSLNPQITVEDYVKAIKIADRDLEQSFRPGWAAKVKVHINKKTYNRKAYKNIEE